MATLTETAYHARKAINYGILGIIFLIFLKIGLSGLISYWKKIHPPPPPPPNVLFGKLPEIEFPTSDSTTSALTYKLETVTGDYPKIPNQAKVYFMPQISANLLGLDSAKEAAKKMRFEAEPLKIDDRNYRWVDQKYPSRILTMDIVNGNFNLIYDYRDDQSVLAEKDLPGKERAISEAKSLLSNLNLLKSDLEEGRITVSYLRIDNNNLLEVNSLLEANFVKVSFLRGQIGKMPVYYSVPNKAPIIIILSGSKEEAKKLVSLEYNYQIIDYENFATYPIILPSKAFEDLKAGRGYVASYQGSKNEVVIREIVLGYFDSEKTQAYLQPVFVFLGDENFVGFIPAIKEEWVVK